MIVDTQDSALGRWITARWSPEPNSPLHGLVERIWYFDGTLAYARERVFPDGNSELVVMLDEPHRDGDDSALAHFPAICINGLRTRPSVVVAPLRRCRVLGIVFAPLGAAALLRCSMPDLLDVTIDVRAAIGRGADELAERCADAAETSAWNGSRNAASALRAAAHWAEQRIGRDGEDEVVRWATGTIREARGAIVVDEMSARLGVSRSQFVRRFRHRTGVTPKYFARIVRFSNALPRLSRGGDIASVATELGYYDQAHMYRDFEEFARMTPGDFVAATRFPGSASVAEK